jgi:hypothetical protein
MKFPPGWSRSKLPRTRGNKRSWRVTIAGHVFVLSGQQTKHPGSIRKRIENILGLKSDDDMLTAKIRAHVSKSYGSRLGTKKRLHTPVGWFSKGKPQQTSR